MKLDMDCTDNYYNLQPSTNDHSKHIVYYKSEALQLTPPPFNYVTHHF